MKKINALQFICPTGFYGAERWVLALANNIDPAKVRCDLAVTKESEAQNLEIVKQYPKHEGRAYELPMKGRFDLAIIGQLCDLIKEREIDVIHTHGYKSDILGLIAAKKTGIRCVSTPHGFGEHQDFKLRMYVKLGAFCLRFFDKVAPLSKQLLDEVIAYGVPASKSVYIQNGVDLKEVDEMLKGKEPRTSDQKKRIGFIGQMILRKNIFDTLNIFDRIWKKNNNVELLLLGDGDQRSALEAHAAQLESSSAIQFLGFRKDRLELLRSFDLFVMTSTSEGIPRCLMEAMAMEIPVAAYEIMGIDQLVTHEKTGLLAQLGEVSTLESYWEKLLYDQEYAQSLASAGRQFVLDEFSAARMSREYVDLFETLLTSKEPH